jgi:PilZ domain-containing protein
MGGKRRAIVRRRSARHLLGHSAELHIGPNTHTAVVQDISQHGMGLVLPDGVSLQEGDVVWILAKSVASYAITATVRRVFGDGGVGVEFVEVLGGEALEVLEGLPLAGEGSVDLVDEESQA